MNRKFAADVPALLFVSKMGDIMLVNLYFMICSLPLFTIGASWTALYATTMKIVRKEELEEGLTKTFFKAFKLNFKQASLIWLILVMIGAFFGMDFYLLKQMEKPNVFMQYGLFGLFIVYVAVLLYVFPILARFDNSIGNTLRNALLMMIAHFPQTLIMLGTIVVLVLGMGIPYVDIILLSFWVFIGFGGLAYLFSRLFCQIFKQYEGESNN